MQDTVKRFKAHLAKMHAYSHAMGVLYYDSETAMPKGGVEGLGATIGVMSEESYRLSTAPELKEMLRTLNENKDALDMVTRREAEEMAEELSRMEKIPMEEFVAYQVAQNEAGNVWRQAKVNNDFAAFAPHLEKLIGYQRKFAGYIHPEMKAYDALLDQYEKGLTMETLDAYFKNVREKLVPLIHAIAERGRKIDTSFLDKEFAVEKQKQLSDHIMKVMCIDRSFCAIGETEHPFTTNFNKRDVRITTHYYPESLLSSFYSVVHEGGHATYELNTGDDLFGSPLGGGASMGIHESQSRFFENIIGRSREFIGLVYPKLMELFPEELKGVTEEMLYLAANRSEPSLIRTEADELTYSLHIMVRYELEKQLIGGTLTVKELPEKWNALYKEYLGVDVPDDSRGVLQDTHWSGGMFGYFPSYSIGSAYASQIYDAMMKEMDVPALVKEGKLQPVIDWLTEKIYRFGCLKKPGELIENACGAAFDPGYYTDYLKEKYSAIYGL
ncbi:MAG: carboxypeptidase M32 [Clostridiales bacterium]|nr:carboxypeptidase M32 [Clostridiales bacterium]